MIGEQVQEVRTKKEAKTERKRSEPINLSQYDMYVSSTRSEFRPLNIKKETSFLLLCSSSSLSSSPICTICTINNINISISD